MKTRSLAAAAVLILFLGAALPAVNWAQNGSPDFDTEAFRKEAIKMRKAEEARRSADAKRAMEKLVAKATADVKRVEEAVRVRESYPGWAGPPEPRFLAKMKGLPRHLTQIQDVAEKYRDGKDESQKEKALKELKELVSKYFEEDMQVRKQELAEIESRLEKLRAQLDRRREKKDEIVDLQVKVAINEAEGLGFTSAPRENFMFNVRVPAPTVAPVEIRLPNRPEVTIAPPAPPSADVFMAAPVPVPAPGISVDVSNPMATPPVEVDVQLLGVGAKGEAVRELQRALNKELELSPELAVDGDFGPETEKAVKTFQAQHDLLETGVMDETTREKLGLPAEVPPFVSQ